jgi:HEPN domain-containing protein/predicted nucleotidyltransferase
MRVVAPLGPRRLQLVHAQHSEAVVERLVERYEPDRIVLFGSHARGNASPGSDIDLLIVKQTDRRPLDRRVEVEGLLADRALALDLVVYTPAELRELHALGDPFVVDVLETGRVLYMRKPTAAWLRDAREDLESATILLEHGKHRGACFHSQQCVEKALKALLLERGLQPARTHDLVELLHAVEGAGWSAMLSTDDAVFLNSVYRGRYPTEAGLLPHGEPAIDDARRAVAAAGEVMRVVQAVLGGRA